MDHAARAQSLFDRELWVATIDEASMALAAGAPELATPMRMLVGRALEKLNQRPPAIRYFNLVLADDPGHARALAHRGAVFQAMGPLDRARADLDAALAIDPDVAHAWEFRLYNAFDSREPAMLDRCMAELDRLGASNGYHHRLRAQRRLEAGDRAGAEEDLRKACAHAKGDALAGELLSNNNFELRNGDEHAMLGVRLEQSGPMSALQMFQKALELGVSSPRRDTRVVEKLGKLLLAQGRRDEAVAAATALTDRHADSADAWAVRARITGDSAAYQRAFELSARDGAEPYARHLMGAGRNDEALAVCTARLADDPDDAPLSRLLGELHLAAGRRDDAKAAWLAAEALGDTPARTLRVQAFGPERGLDHFDAALDLLDRRMREDAAAEFETAVDAFRQELRAPGDAAHRYLAKALYNSALLRELKVPDEVIEPNLREAVELDGAYADAMSSLGTLCLRTDRVDEGLQWFARAGETDPTAGQPWYYRARHFAEGKDDAQAVEDATKAFDAYARRGQTQFAADAIMMRGRCNENLGRLQDALRDYDLAYEYGHPTGYAMGDHIRQRIAVEDRSSDQAQELLQKVVERIEDGECPWAQIDFLESRTAGDEKATALVAKLKAKTPLDADEVSWLVEFLHAS